MYYIKELFDFLFRVPLIGVLFFLPISIMTSKFYKKRIYDKHAPQFKNNIIYLLLIGGLYSVYIRIISTPIFYNWSPQKTVGNLILSITLYLIFLFSTKLWYSKRHNLLIVPYSLYFIFLLYPSWFFYTYLYIVYILIYSLRNKWINLNFFYKLLITAILISFIFGGFSLFIYWDFFLEPSMYF